MLLLLMVVHLVMFLLLKEIGFPNPSTHKMTLKESVEKFQIWAYIDDKMLFLINWW